MTLADLLGGEGSKESRVKAGQAPASEPKNPVHLPTNGAEAARAPAAAPAAAPAKMAAPPPPPSAPAPPAPTPKIFTSSNSIEAIGRLGQQLKELLRHHAATDFLIREGQPVWYRKNGSLQKSDYPDVTARDFSELLVPELNTLKEADFKLDQTLEGKGDTDFAMEVGGSRFRVNLFWSEGRQLALAMRVLPEEIPEMTTLGLPKSFAPLLKNSRGLLLVTGATGSGKTTTLASSINYLNANTHSHIITLEDPIEYKISSKMSLVNQRQIGRDAQSFGIGLRSALRQDPDILLIGELRDYETVKTALDAANTGHLVLGTLHTNSAQQTIERLTSFFSEEQKDWAQAVIAQVLLGVLSQVLVPRTDTGKRILAAEIMINTPDVRQLIREGRIHQIFNSMDTGSSKGHVLLNRVLKDYVRNGIVSKEDALCATYDQGQLLKEML